SKIELKEDFQNFIYSKLPLLSVVFLYLTNLAFEKSYGFFWFSLLKYLIISFTLFEVPVFVRFISNYFVNFDKLIVVLYFFSYLIVAFGFLGYFLLSIHSVLPIIIVIVTTLVFFESSYFYISIGRSLSFIYFSISSVALFLPSVILFSIFADFYSVEWFEFLIQAYILVFNTTFAFMMVYKVIDVYRNYETTFKDFSEKLRKEENLYRWFVVFLISILEARDPYIRGHSERVAKYSYNLAKIWYNNTYIPNFIELGALLHDIGKIGVRDEVLLYPGGLDEEMKVEMKQHPRIGKELLQVVDSFRDVSDIAYLHHEKLDGSGYPLGIKASDIPEYVKIVTIADSFDAMNSARVYRKDLDFGHIMEEFKKFKGIQFDSKLVDVFVKNINRII
ncbi:MAG: HD-GYP domain-containing protein, partial [Brevinematia bacterium]